MQCRVKMSKMKECLPLFLVAWLIVCSGSQHFRILHSFFTNIFLLLMAIVYFFYKKRITKSNYIRVGVIGIVLGINVFIGVYINHYHFKLNSAMIFCISCVVLVILQSSMTAEDFKRKYIYFMTMETVISLICFVLVTYFNFDNLPGYYEHIVPYTDRPGHNIIYLTPYYTMGWFSTHGYFRRNAGMFWEPGAHAVYLNLAILFVFNGALDNIKPKSRNIILGILLLGALSTKSTTGYLALALCFIFLIFREPKKWNTRKNFMIIMAVIMALFFVAVFGSVLDKLIFRSGSYGTRYNDTVSGLSVAFENWILGKGMFVDISDVLSDVGIGNISNGMVELLIKIGFPMFTLYLVSLHTGLKRLFHVSGIALYSVELIFFLLMNSESLCTFPVFLSLLFSWQKETEVYSKENFK